VSANISPSSVSVGSGSFGSGNPSSRSRQFPSGGTAGGLLLSLPWLSGIVLIATIPGTAWISSPPISWRGAVRM
jgi:hypothetical protein